MTFVFSGNKKQVAHLKECVLSTSKEIKTGLENQKRETHEELEKVKGELESRELLNAERETQSVRTEEYMQEKQRLLSAKWKLEQKKDRLDELLNMTDTLLHNTQTQEVV